MVSDTANNRYYSYPANYELIIGAPSESNRVTLIRNPSQVVLMTDGPEAMQTGFSHSTETGDSPRIGYIHSGGTNALFVAGHVEWKVEGSITGEMIDQDE